MRESVHGGGHQLQFCVQERRTRFVIDQCFGANGDGTDMQAGQPSVSARLEGAFEGASEVATEDASEGAFEGASEGATEADAPTARDLAGRMNRSGHSQVGGLPMSTARFACSSGSRPSLPSTHSHLSLRSERADAGARVGLA